jgi:hypothetical protein
MEHKSTASIMAEKNPTSDEDRGGRKATLSTNPPSGHPFPIYNLAVPEANPSSLFLKPIVGGFSIFAT